MEKDIKIFLGLTAIGIFLLMAKKMIVDSWLKPIEVTRISSPYGYRTHPITKERHFHNGIDLPAPIGTPIKATRDGEILSIYTNEIGGLQMIAKHDNNYRTGYAHLSKVILKKGEKFKQGDIIALVGNTGRSTGAHLHLTLRDSSGTLVNPALLLYGRLA